MIGAPWICHVLRYDSLSLYNTEIYLLQYMSEVLLDTRKITSAWSPLLVV